MTSNRQRTDKRFVKKGLFPYRRLAWIGMAAAVIAIAPFERAPAAITYRIEELGDLGGNHTIAYDINSVGQVTGQSMSSSEVDQAFLYSNGAMINLGGLYPAHNYSVGSDVTLAGQVVGYANTSADSLNHAFLYSNETLTDIGAIIYPDGYSEATGINDRGAIVGSYHSIGGSQQAFLYSEGVVTTLGTLGGPGAGAVAINNGGKIVGYSSDELGYFHAFLYDGTAMIDLGTLAEGRSSSASSISDSGFIVGDGTTASFQNHPFLYFNGVMTDLGTLGGSHSYATDVNNAGTVVGSSLNASNVWRAFLYADGTIQSLDDLIPPGTGWTLESAEGINDLGQIVGYGSNALGATRAFLLTPVPEVSTLALLMVPLIAAGWVRFRSPSRRRTSAADEIAG